MAVETTPVTVVGAGSWGTALALSLARHGHPVTLVARRPAQAEELTRRRENPQFLPGHAFPDNLTATAEPAAGQVADGAILVAVPSHAFRASLEQLRDAGIPATTPIAWATKGLEHATGLLLHEVAAQVLGRERACAVVSGPTFAREMAAGLPCAVTVASRDPDLAALFAGVLHGDAVRAYTHDDVVGVEVGGAVKNVLAIAAGIADGLGLGANARAALITRGLTEITRLGQALGGQRETFMGLAGLGDLVLTCTDDQSRNRRFGLALGRGEAPEAALAAIGQVVEGMPAAANVIRRATEAGVEMPIAGAVDAVLAGHLSPHEAVDTLLARAPRQEM